MSEVQTIDWQGLAGLKLENERLRIVVLPEMGAKIVSLFDKAYQHEWLVPPMRPLRMVGYGADFVAQDMSGWDEMMPTINRCTWAGEDLPDHGEIWGIPWTVEADSSSLSAWVAGRAFPYRFSRSITLEGEASLVFRYTVHNTGPADLPYLWAAHPQFAADENTRILLPPETKTVVNVVGNDPLWGGLENELAWPQDLAADGQVHPLDRVRPVEVHGCRKFYLPPDRPAQWAALRQEDTGCQLRLEWDSQEVPYLGVWVDEGACNVRRVAALEPANGYYDGLVTAAAKGRAAVLPAGRQQIWRLHLRFID